MFFTKFSGVVAVLVIAIPASHQKYNKALRTYWTELKMSAETVYANFYIIDGMSLLIYNKFYI